MDVGRPEEMHWLIPGNTQEEKDENQHRVYINYCKYYMPDAYRRLRSPAFSGHVPNELYGRLYHATD